MAWCPFAEHKPLPENKLQAAIDPDQAIVHSAVDSAGPTSLYGYFVRVDVTVETHFFVKLDGRIEQYMDTNVRADGNRHANVRAISIETEDDGDPNQRRWTPAQVASIKRLLEWLFEVHPKILRRVCPAWDEAGVGWHVMFGAPGPWTPVVGKTCPGTVRVEQFKEEIVPWLYGGESEEDDLADYAEQIEQIDENSYGAREAAITAVAEVRALARSVQTHRQHDKDQYEVLKRLVTALTEEIRAIKERL